MQPDDLREAVAKIKWLMR